MEIRALSIGVAVLACLAGIPAPARAASPSERPHGQFLTPAEVHAFYLKAVKENRRAAKAAAIAKLESDPNAVEMDPITVYGENLLLNEMVHAAMDPAFEAALNARLQEVAPDAYHRAVMIARNNDRFFQAAFQPNPGWRRPQAILVNQHDVMAAFVSMERWFKRR